MLRPMMQTVVKFNLDLRRDRSASTNGVANMAAVNNFFAILCTRFHFQCSLSAFQVSRGCCASIRHQAVTIP